MCDGNPAPLLEALEHDLTATIRKWCSKTRCPQRISVFFGFALPQILAQILGGAVAYANYALFSSLASRLDPAGIWIDHVNRQPEHFDKAETARSIERNHRLVALVLVAALRVAVERSFQLFVGKPSFTGGTGSYRSTRSSMSRVVISRWRYTNLRVNAFNAASMDPMVSLNRPGFDGGSVTWNHAAPDVPRW
jgi:hypothetical protein